MLGVLKFFVWSDADGLGWLFGMAVRAVFWLVLLLIALAVVNPRNPAYNPADRSELDAQAQTYTQTGTRPQRWDKLMRSASAECHFRETKPQEFIISGTLPDEYIVSGKGEIRWYVRFPALLQPTLFGPSPIKTDIVTMAQFYTITNTEKFEACTTKQALTARVVIGL